MTVASASTPRPNLFSVLRLRNFALLWGSQAISQLGDGLFYVAEIWLVLQLTGSALAMGTTVILTMLPRLALQLIGGVSVDRYDRQRLMVLSDAARCLCVLAFAILVAARQIQMVHVYLLSIAFGIVSAFFDPAQQAILPNLVPEDGLVAANSLVGLTRQLSQILGPAVAGVLISLPNVGVAGVSFFNAASFAAGAIGVAAMQVPTRPDAVIRTNGSFWHALQDGIRYVFGFRALVIILLLAMVLNFAIGPLEILLPVFVKSALGQGSEAFGVLSSVFAGGMVVGSLLVGAWSPRAHRGILIFASTTIGGILVLIAGSVPVFAVTSAMLALLGLLIAIVNTLLPATMQVLIADEYRGRVFSVMIMISSGLMPVAMALGGALSDAIGPGWVLAVGGALAIVASLAGFLFPEIRELQ